MIAATSALEAAAIGMIAVPSAAEARADQLPNVATAALAIVDRRVPIADRAPAALIAASVVRSVRVMIGPLVVRVMSVVRVAVTGIVPLVMGSVVRSVRVMIGPPVVRAMSGERRSRARAGRRNPRTCLPSARTSM